LKTLLAIIGIIFGVMPECDGAVCKGYLSLKAELPTIRKAAERNGIKYGSDDWYLASGYLDSLDMEASLQMMNFISAMFHTYRHQGTLSSVLARK
jgi:hypothetical protein